MGLELQVYTGGPVMCNAYLLRGTDGYVAVDAPAGFADWLEMALPQGAELKHLLITHAHYDHVQGVAELQARTGCCVHAFAPYSKSLTLELLGGHRSQGPLVPPFHVDDAFGEARREDTWGGLPWQIRHIPGHATDGVAYILPQEKAMFVGDILFAGSIGRTDFPGGSTRALVQGIQDKLLPYGRDFLVFSGHGPASSIGEELQDNPYLGAHF